MNIFLFHFEMVFPYNRVTLNTSTNGKWLTKGILISTKKMKHLNNIRRIVPLAKKDLEYIKRYHYIYRRIIGEAKKGENDRYIEAASNRSRATWKIINKESGIRKVQNDEIKLKIGKEIISNPTEIAEKMNEFFTNTAVNLVKQNRARGKINVHHQVIKHAQNLYLCYRQ